MQHSFRTNQNHDRFSEVAIETDAWRKAQSSRDKMDVALWKMKLNLETD